MLKFPGDTHSLVAFCSRFLAVGCSVSALSHSFQLERLSVFPRCDVFYSPRRTHRTTHPSSPRCIAQMDMRTWTSGSESQNYRDRTGADHHSLTAAPRSKIIPRVIFSFSPIAGNISYQMLPLLDWIITSSFTLIG